MYYTQEMTRQLYELHRWQTFDDFCNNFKKEVGETLFEKCRPMEETHHCVSLYVPDNNVKRIRDTLNYGRCNTGRFIKYLKTGEIEKIPVNL